MSEPSDAIAIGMRVPGVVPYTVRGSTFHRHCRTHGVLALTTTSLGMFTPLVAGALGFVTLGLGWGVLAASVSTLAAVSIVNIAALLGNDKLEARLREEMGLDSSHLEFEFVGLCRSENNTLRGKYLTPRLDTDDNVGFLTLTDSQLVIATEEGPVVVQRDAIHEIGRVRCVELPYLSWIRIEFENADELPDSFLLMSRKASTIRQIRTRTEELYARLIDWHAEAQLRWLDDHR